MFFSISVYTTYLVHSCTQAAVVGKSYQKHFLALKCGRGTLPTGLQRVKKTLLACGVPDAACEDAALLRQVGEFFWLSLPPNGFQINPNKCRKGWWRRRIARLPTPSGAGQSVPKENQM